MFINVNKLSNKVGSINESIKYYESALFDTISCIKNMKYSWYDGYTISFFKNIDKENNNANNLVDEMNSIINIIKSISNSYDRLGRSIIGYNGFINSDNYIYNGIDITEDQAYKNNISNQIYNIEDNISSYISKTSFYNINNNNYDTLDLIDDTNDFIGMKDNMVNEIKALESKINNLKNASISITNNFQFNIDIYNSPNYYKIKKMIEQLNYDINLINNNIMNAYNYIKKRQIEIYKLSDDLLESVDTIK